MTWIGGTGAAVSEEAVILDYGRGREVDLTRYLEVCRSAVVDTGGSVLTRSQMYSLTVEAGQVVGVEVYSAGEHVAFTAPWTLLATGGFQADPELIATYIHPNAAENAVALEPGQHRRRVACRYGDRCGHVGGHGRLLRSPRQLAVRRVGARCLHAAVAVPQ